MVVRIYSLAKELKLDSKDLVEICTRAGVPGKGSALASLTEEEVTKVKAYMAGGGTATKSPAKAAPAAAPTAPAAESTVMRREDYIAPTGTVVTTRPLPPGAAPRSGSPTRSGA